MTAMKTKNVAYIALGTVLILLIPLILTLLNPSAGINGGSGGGWDWSPSDFVIMGIMLFGTGLMLDFTLRRTGKYRMLIAAAIVIAFLWLWVELAVGLFTNWGS